MSARRDRSYKAGRHDWLRARSAEGSENGPIYALSRSLGAALQQRLRAGGGPNEVDALSLDVQVVGPLDA